MYPGDDAGGDGDGDADDDDDDDDDDDVPTMDSGWDGRFK